MEVLTRSDELVWRLWDTAHYFQNKPKDAGFDIGGTETPIIPVMLGEEKIASAFSRKLFDENIFAQAISYPTVPKGKARIRCMLSAAHEKEDLDFAQDAFVRVARVHGV